MPAMHRGVVALVLAAGSAHAATVLQRVEVVRSPSVEVRVHLSSPVVPLARTLPADDAHPARVYLDLPDATLDPSTPNVIAGTGQRLLRVRTGQFDATTVRVVLDLTDAVPFAVHDDGRTIVIALAPPPAPPPQAEVAPPPTPAEPPPRPAPPPLAAPVPRTPAGPPRLVVLDAGHGGHDPGATGIGGVIEKTLTLDVTRRVAERLARRDVEVVLTRDDDRFVAIDDRIARALDATVFVSLHANAAADVNLNGFEVFYGGGGIDAAASGPRSPVRLGLDVSEAIGHALGSEVRTVVRPGKFGVLARNTVPSVLVEIGYLTNPDDAARLRDDGYRARIAEAIADGAAAFVEGSLDVASR